jgi:hypothetical protein
MPRKSLTDRRAEKLAQLDAIKRDLAALETKAGERLGKLALKAGLADLDLDDDTRSSRSSAPSRGGFALPRTARSRNKLLRLHRLLLTARQRLTVQQDRIVAVGFDG